MTRTEHLLAILNEECCEVGQRADKALRFGVNEVQEGQDQTNAQRIVYEFSQLYAMMSMLVEEGVIQQDMIDWVAVGDKKRNVEKWLLYSKEQGTLQ